MSYQPLQVYSPQHDITLGHTEEERLILTQRPTIYIESHKNKGGEMTLPFFYYKNWLKLNLTDVIGMGKIDFYPLSNLHQQMVQQQIQLISKFMHGLRMSS
jgi:hypothetical protein